MNLSGIADLGLGLILVYLLFSLACSKINEAVASALRFRARGLERGLRRLLDGSKRGAPATGDIAASRLTFEQFLAHDLITTQQPSKRPPSYVHPTTFALGVMDLLAPALPQLLDEMRTAAAGNPAVLAVLNDANLGDAAKVLGIQQLQAPAPASPPPVPPPVPPVVPTGILGGFLGGSPTASTVEAGGLPVASVGAPAPPAAAPVALTPLLQSLLAQALGSVNGDLMAQLEVGVALLPDGHPAKVPLARFLAMSGGDMDKFVASLEGWFNGAMDRLSGWYKRRTQLFLIGYAVVLTAAVNVDSITIATTLYRNGPERAAVAAAAQKAPDIATAQDAIRKASDLSLPIGWVRRTNATIDPATGIDSASPGREFPPRRQDLALKLLGLAITVGALLFGSTFWFDVLGKVANLRNAGPKPAPPPAAPS